MFKLSTTKNQGKLAQPKQALVEYSTKAPLDAEYVFFGGDVWHTLSCQVGGTPRKKVSALPNQPTSCRQQDIQTWRFKTQPPLPNTKHTFTHLQFTPYNLPFF